MESGFTLSGNRINATIGNVTQGNQQVAVTGKRINLATGTVDVISWNRPQGYHKHGLKLTH